ncbi:MAG: serine/threonine protein kinase, partial [Deltaproteobacteria bacterium]|nr:serine/threonine protein kinase [Deltaproteobacteria bacterium]
MPTYRLTGRLEQGELAELYKAEREDGSQVIIKLFHPRTSDAAYAQALAQTGQVLNPLAHAGVVHFLELGMVGGRLALVREYVDGFTLGVALQRLATKEVVLPPAVALHLIIGLLEIVQRAHDAGLVHGAITPGNVLLSYEGHPWLCDFGALQALEASPALRSLAGRGRGTYRAPEVNKGEPPTVESDVYSLGALAYELLTLKELNPGKGMSTRREAIQPPSRVDRRINGRVDPIIMRSVEMLPTRRYRSCAELTAALRNFLSVAGGMPSREDVARFVGELFPNEVRVEMLG